ncbi:hypothetical protein PG987_005539 [Apiospora arundinis]
MAHNMAIPPLTYPGPSGQVGTHVNIHLKELRFTDAYPIEATPSPEPQMPGRLPSININQRRQV